MNWKCITASILLFSIFSATSAFAVVAPPTIQCALYENGELQQKACERIYGNLAEKFDRPVASWKLRGSFNALDTTWKDEKLSYELFLFETSGRLSLESNTYKENCDLDFDLQS